MKGLVLIVIAFIAGCSEAPPEKLSDCNHVWGKWALRSNKEIYGRSSFTETNIQVRQCEKCGWLESARP